MRIKKIVSLPPAISQEKIAQTPPHLIYNNGPLLASVEIITLFWGEYWNLSTNQSLIKQINGFFEYIVQSDQITKLKEYSTKNYTITNGSFITTQLITSPKLPSLSNKKALSDAAIQKMIQTSIKNKSVPSPTPNSLYFVFVPPNIPVELQKELSCSTFCGYHDVTKDTIFYAVVPYPCTNCLNGLSIFDAITVISSHELCEAITDPIPANGWYDQNYGEIGDICVGQTKKIGNYKVQLEWSNKANSCM